MDTKDYWYCWHIGFRLRFFLTFKTPEWVEQVAFDYIEHEVTAQIDEQIDSIQPPAEKGTLSRFASALYQKNEAEIQQRRESLRRNAHERTATAVADIRNLDCECRAMWAAWLKQEEKARIRLLGKNNAALDQFIFATYANVTDDLKRDIRIFTGTNTLIFLLLLAITVLKPQASLHLFVPGLLLGASTAICSFFYIFEQNWLLTIIHSDYLGFTYFAYLGLVFCFLCDIALNKARITTRIINTMLNAVGSVGGVLPC